VAEREGESHAERLAALLQQEPCGVVDGSDVVGVERVAQPEDVGEAGGAGVEERAVRVGNLVVFGHAVVVDEQAEPDDMERHHDAQQPGQP